MSPADCAAIRPLLAELAAGTATGHDRAEALRHVARCPACEQELAATARAADELLLLMPAREPSAGFESAVVARMLAATPPRAPRAGAIRRAVNALGAVVRPRPPRLLAVVRAAVVLVLVAALGAGLVWWRTGPDRRLADGYRQTLATANGSYLRAARLVTESGTPAGHVFLYQGSPSWVMVAITDAPTPGDYAVTVVRDDGRRDPIGVCRAADGTGTVGYELPVSVRHVASIEATGPGGVRLTAVNEIPLDK